MKRLLALCVLWPVLAAAQQRDTMTARTILPRDVALEVAALFNATTALRATTATDIEAARTITGNVAVLNGPVIIAGHVTGRVLAINADVELRAGARIDGDLLVVGGEVDGQQHARIGGEIRVYHPPLRFTQEGDQLVATPEDDSNDQWWRRWERRGRRNFNTLEIASGGPYNRVEGLPVVVGPVLYRDQGWGHLKLATTAIVRTGSSFSSAEADVGHDVRGEVRIGQQYGVTLTGRLFDVVEGIEQWQLANSEVSFGSFFLHRDYRDYFERHGGRVQAALRATDNADFTVSYGDERWSSRATNDPFSIFHNGGGWRQNPLVDDGRMHVANATIRVDTRNDDFNPWAGWYVLADVERGSGHLDQLAPTSAGVRSVVPGVTSYVRGFVDMRKYNRLGPAAGLNLRVVAGGWLSGDALPVERRLSIDGPGTVPGFDFRATGGNDVGTCGVGTPLPGRPAQCERIALAQLEYRSDIRLSSTSGDPGNRHVRFRADGAWVFFADAGRGWLVNAPNSALNYGRMELPPLSTYRTDLGGGLDFDQFGIYVAKALSVPQEPANVFVRIRHRF